MKTGRVFVATEIAGPRVRLVAVLAAAAASLSIALLQAVVLWQGDRAEYLLLAAINAFLATLATWFFHIRWKLIHDRFDRQVKNVYLPIACHFWLLLTLQALVSSQGVVDAFVASSWVLSQTLAAMVLIYTFSGGREHSPGIRALRTGAALAAAAVVSAFFWFLHDRGLVQGVAPIEVGLATLFLLAAVVPMLGGREQRQPREVWLGAAFLLTAVAHFDLSWSSQQFDSPFMWGYVLLAFSLGAPMVGAVFENVTLLESQTALSDRLKRLRHRVEILLDSLPVLVLSVDRNRNIRFANRAASRLFEVPAGTADTDGQPMWMKRIHPNHQPQVYAAIPAVLEGSKGQWEEIVRVDGPDGNVHWLNTQMHPVVDPVVGETLIQIVATDVTDLHLARRAVEGRQTRLAFLSGLAQTLAGEVEEHRILERFLETGRELLPLRSLLLYRPLPDGSGLRLEIGTGPGAEAFEENRAHPITAGDHPCWTAFNEGAPQTTPTSTALPSELAEWLATEHEIRHLSYLPLMAAGQSEGVLLATSSSQLNLAANDIELLIQVGFLLGGAVSLSRLVRELDEQRAVAFEASRLKSEFLANTSHELRTPLTAILGFLRLIIDGAVKDPEKEREFLRIAHESAESLLNIINDVLDLAKIEAGRLEVHFAPVPVRKVLEDVETLFKHQMKSKGLVFRIKGADSKLVIWTDSDRTSQVLTNLLSNALKFTDRGGSITLSCEERDRRITFSVADTGIGISADELERIFSSFYQVDGSTTRPRGGTGLGLTISRRLAELMGGTLELTSEGPGCGATARLILEEFTTDHEATNPELRVPI